MRRLAILVAVLLLVLPSRVAAQSEGTSQAFLTGPGRVWVAPVAVSGVVSVDFHGDRGAGCEQAGLCDVSGNETWDPTSRGQLLAFGRKHPEAGTLAFGADAVNGGGTTTARVHRTAPDGSPHICSDAAAARGGGDLTSAHGSLAIGLAGGAEPFTVPPVFGTRCAGPLDADVVDLLPVGRLTPAQVEAGHARVDLTTERSFAAHGLAGTLRSSVVLTLGKAARQATEQHQPRLPVRRSLKVITVRYAIERVAGQAALRFGGLTESALCDALDACDLKGETDISLNASRGTAELVAFGSGRLSRRQLLARVGLLPLRRHQKLSGGGTGFWRGGGTVSSTETRSGAPACRDTAALPGGALVLAEAGRRLVARYSVGVDTGGGGLPTRCPGPATDDLGDEGIVVTGSMPASVLRRRRVVLRLRRGASFAGQGYAGSSTADVTVVLRRRKIRVTRLDEPGPPRGGGSDVVDEIVAFAPGGP